MESVHPDSFESLRTFMIHGQEYHYYSLPAAAIHLGNISSLPFSLKILLENLLRNEDGKTVTAEDIKALAAWGKERRSDREVAFRPARVLMQDFTGVPAVVDLAAMRTAMSELKQNPEKINPLNTVDLVIDHSVQVDTFGSNQALKQNVSFEMKRNLERYELLCWAQKAFKNFRVVPPGTGICHQVNLEYLAKVVWTQQHAGRTWAYPDTLVGTDSHTTMINGLAVLGWGVGGIEAEAAMLGQPISMLIPEVIGFKLEGELQEGITATDLVLTVTQMLRAKGVVGKFVEFYGTGLDSLPLADRATIANMTPEFGATCGFFPIDQETLHYLHLTGRSEKTISLVENYAKSQGLWRDSGTPDPVFTDTLYLDLSTVEPSLAGPKRPQDRVSLHGLPEAFYKLLESNQRETEKTKAFPTQKADMHLHHGDVVIAAITSCTNTSNPSVLIAAGLLAKKAIEKGLKIKPWVKSSLAPGSQVVTDYLEKTGLQTYLDQLGFNLVGYGCTTCIGNSGPLPEVVSEAIQKNDLIVSSVLSGNRNFEGRIHPQVKANWLASPPLVVAFALAGTTCIDLNTQSLGEDQEGRAVYLRDLWPSQQEITQEMSKIDGAMFKHRYASVFDGDDVWKGIKVGDSSIYPWNVDSTYVQYPPFFQNFSLQAPTLENVQGARVLALLGDSITTDHISPAGSIKADSPAGAFLLEKGISEIDFNSYGARRGNHEVMMRGTFANIRIRNEMVPDKEGGFTKHFPSGQMVSIYEAAMRYQEEGVPLVIVAGQEYGTGSSRDWAAKGTRLLGVKAVIAESFERIHRSNLIGMGVLPLEFPEGVNRKTLKLDGSEIFDIHDIAHISKPRTEVRATIKRVDGSEETIKLLSRIDTLDEVEYYLHGGILQYVLRQLVK